MPGRGVRIAVGKNGEAWVVQSNNRIFQWYNGRWRVVSGRATDIAVGANGDVWAVGSRKARDEGYYIFKYYP